MSIRNDLNVDFKFPEPQELTIRLKDVLESQVDEKYYLSDEQTKRLKMTTYNTGSEKVRVQNTDGEARTLCARDYKDPKCVRVAGNLNHYNYDKMNRVYDSDGSAPTVDTMEGGGRQPKVLEPIIVASRGRNPENPSDRSAGQKLEQRLEPNTQGITNTITSVAKDNYVAEPAGEVQIVDDIYKNRKPRVYNKTAPTLRAHHAGDLKVVGGVPIRTANKQGYDMATDGDGVDLSYPQSKTKRGRVGHGVSKTLMGADCMGTIDNYRIRKLTPKECWRLMSFDDEDFNKAKASGVSDSQLYKQAGNSIVVKVLEGILRNLLTDQ